MSNILNATEGLDIDKLVSVIKDDVTGEEKKYMPVQNRVLWFRTTNPLGKIVTNILEKNEEFAIVEARVYLSKDDDDKNYVAKGIAQRHFSKESIYATRNIEWAETAAIGRALSLAGFGTQFCSDELNDNGMVDSPSVVNNKKANTTSTNKNVDTTNKNTTVVENTPKANPKTKDTKIKEEVAKDKPKQTELKEEPVKTSEKTTQSEPKQEPVKTSEKTTQSEPKEEPVKTDEKTTYNKLTPTDEILKYMTLEDVKTQ